MKRLKPASRELTPRMKQVVSYMFENPHKTQVEIAKAIGISDSRVNQILNSNRVLQAFPTMARAKVKSLVPKAIRRYAQLLEQTDNLEVSRKVADRLLDTNKILDPETKVQVNIFADLTSKDLVERARNVEKISVKDVVEAELADSDDESH